jgi:hypothetical protein
MNIISDDPRLTAYVLDELDQGGNKFIENEMARSNECRFEARELADFTDQLRAALATEPMPELTPGHKLAIEARLQQTGSRRKPFWVPIGENWLLKTGLAILTVLVLCIVLVSANLITPVTKVFAQASTQAARVMLQVVGVRGQWRGTLLVLPQITIDFTNCDPLLWTAILLILAGASLVAGNLYLRSLWRRLALTTIVVPLVVLSNSLHKFALVEWILHTNRGPGEMQIFELGQLVFFVFPLFALLPFLIWLRRSERRSSES